MLGLGSSSTLGIGLAVYLDDKFTNPSQRLTRQVNAMGLSVDQFKGHVRTLEVFAGGVLLASNALKTFAKFDKTMTSTAIIGGDIPKSSALFKSLEDNTLKLSSVYGQLPSEIALTNLELAKAGKTVPEIMKLSEAVTALGAATDTKVGGAGGAAEMLVNTMQAFNAASSEADKYANIMTSAANRSTIDVTDLYESLKYSSDVARNLNIPFQEAATAIATLGNAGLKGSMAGVAYANMLRYISTGVTEFGTDKQKKTLAYLGLQGKDFRDAEGNLKDLGQMLILLRERTEGLSNPDKLGALTALFGVRGARGLVPLMSGLDVDENGKVVQTYEAMRKLIGEDIQSDIAKNTAIGRIDNLAGDINKLASAWERLMIKLGETLSPTARVVLQMLTKAQDLLTGFMDTKLGNVFVKSAAAWILVVRPLRALFAIFGKRLLGIGPSLVSSFNASNTITTTIANKIKAAGNYLVASMLKARNISMMGPGGVTLMGRGKDGRLTGSLGKSNWFTKIIGSIFGIAGLRKLSEFTTWFSKLKDAPGIVSRFLNFMTGTGKVLKLLGFGLGRLLSWVFSWPAMLADIALSLVTGKGLFEWLWDGLKWFGGILYDIGNWVYGLFKEKPKEYTSAPPPPEYSPTPIRMLTPDEFRSTYREVIQQSTGVNLHVTVNPTTGDKKTEHYINTKAERELNGIGIKN